MFSGAVLLSLSLLVTSPSPEPPSPLEVEGETIVVTATRSPEREEALPLAIRRLEREEIEVSAALTLDGVLRQVPGFSLFRRTDSLVAHPTTQGVSLRGVGANAAGRTLVVLDGVTVNDPFGGWVAWSRLPQASLDRIEVVASGGSAVWGSSAVGGVVQLLTQAPSNGVGRGQLTAGSRSTARAEASVGRRFGRDEPAPGRSAAAYVDLAWQHTDGYRLVAPDRRGPIDTEADSEAATLYAKLDRSTNSSSSWSLSGNLYREERANGTPLAANDTTGSFLAASLESGVGDRDRLSLRASFHRQRFANLFTAVAADRASERPALDQFDVAADALRLSLGWRRERAERPGGLSAGVDGSWIDGSTAEDFFFVGAVETGSFSRRRRAGGRQSAAAAYARSWWGGDRWSASAAARVDHWRESGGFRRESVIADGTGLRDDRFPRRSRTVVSPRLGGRWAVSERLSLRALAHRGFRTPTVNELYRPFRVGSVITAANAELEPETLDGLEVGLDARRGPVRFRLTAFANRLSDAVANLTVGPGPGVVAPCGFVPPGGLCRQRGNLERISTLGAEVGAEADLKDGWRLSLDLLAADNEVRRAPGQEELVGLSPAQTPRLSTTLRLTRWNLEPLGGQLAVRYVGEQFEDDRETLPLAAATTVDLTLARELSPRWRLTLAGENLLDEDVETSRDPTGLVRLGTPRSFRLALRWAP